VQVGDLVRFCQQPDPAVGIIVEIDDTPKRGRHCVAIAWEFLDGQIGWQAKVDVEVISESR
jgi:hypothetical protein